MRKPKFITRTLDVTKVYYRTNQSNNILETTLVGTFSGREALQEIRESIESEECSELVTQVVKVEELQVTCKVEQNVFLMVAENEITKEDIQHLINEEESNE